MKPEILQLIPILVPEIRAKLEASYTLHHLYQQTDREAYLREHGGAVRAVITGGQVGIARATMELLPALEVVAVNGVGTDAVDLAYARSRGVAVTATVGALTDDVADLAIGLLIAACRGLCAGDRFVRAGRWVANPSPSAIPLARRFSGMRVGIVGMGRIGRAIATRAVAFGCPIGYTDLRPMDDVPYAFVADLKQLARDSDALVLAAAADKDAGLVDAGVLDALGKDGFLINVARGRLVNEADLVAAVTEGRIAGAGLDVFTDEPNVPAELFAADNVTLQAHRGSATRETRAAMGEMMLTSIAQALAGQRPVNSLTT